MPLLGFLSQLVRAPWMTPGLPPRSGFGRIALETTRPPTSPVSELLQSQPRELTPEQEASVFAQDEIDAFLHFGTWLPVQSSNIRALRYFPDESKLEVEFVSGNFYSVRDISIREAEALARAGSKGKKYWDMVRVRGKGNFWATRKRYEFLFGAQPPQWLRSATTRKIHAIHTRGGAGGVRRQSVLGKSISKILAPRRGRALKGSGLSPGP